MKEQVGNFVRYWSMAALASGVAGMVAAGPAQATGLVTFASPIHGIVVTNPDASWAANPGSAPTIDLSATVDLPGKTWAEFMDPWSKVNYYGGEIKPDNSQASSQINQFFNDPTFFDWSTKNPDGTANAASHAIESATIDGVWVELQTDIDLYSGGAAGAPNYWLHVNHDDGYSVTLTQRNGPNSFSFANTAAYGPESCAQQVNQDSAPCFENVGFYVPPGGTGFYDVTIRYYNKHAIGRLDVSIVPEPGSLALVLAAALAGAVGRRHRASPGR